MNGYSEEYMSSRQLVTKTAHVNKMANRATTCLNRVLLKVIFVYSLDDCCFFTKVSIPEFEIIVYLI